MESKKVRGREEGKERRRLLALNVEGERRRRSSSRGLGSSALPGDPSRSHFERGKSSSEKNFFRASVLKLSMVARKLSFDIELEGEELASRDARLSLCSSPFLATLPPDKLILQTARDIYPEERETGARSHRSHEKRWECETRRAG